MSNDTVIASLQEKIDELNQQAWDLRVYDSDKALELAEETVKLSREINYTKGLAEGLRSLGFANVRLYKNDIASPLLRESLALFESLNDLKGQAVAYEYLGIIERNWGNLGRSLELLLKGNSLIPPSTPLDVEITSCYQIGVTYKHLGNFENALDYLYRSLSLAQKIGMKLMVGYATNIIGSIYFDNGDYKKALEYYQQGLSIRIESNDKWGEAGSLDNIGFAYLKLNELDKATDYCQQSLAISQTANDKKGEANALLHLAEIYQQAGDLLQSAKFSKRSLQIRKSRGDKRGEAEVLLFLSELYKSSNDIYDPHIINWLAEALHIAEEIKAQDLLSKAHYQLHEHYRRNDNYKESLIHLEAHLQVEKELHKNAINQKVSNLEISRKAEMISQRNEELITLNKQIEVANAELKIESSLERVRTTAMAMNEPADMLEVCKIISHELASLEVKEIRNVQTAIFYEDKGTYMNYEFYAKHNKLLVTDVEFKGHPTQYEFAYQMMKGPGEIFTKHLEGEKLEDWYAYQKTTVQFADSYLETASSLNYYWFSLGPVALGISTYLPLTSEQVELFKRFRNVFELAYRRYLDIEKAQLQAREAQIQLALERVRARTMAMQKSDELGEAASLLFQQVRSLGIESYSSGFTVWEKNDTELVSWMCNADGSINPPFHMPAGEIGWHQQQYESWKKHEEYIIHDFTGEEMEKHYQYLRSFPLLDKAFKQSEAAGVLTPQRQVHNAFNFSHGNLLFITLQPVPEAHDIFKRFAKVFEQTYTRFLDLQKAEEQAREAEIELGLERVRARAMAMQKSDELSDLVNTVFNELTKLDFALNWCIINIIDESSLTNTVWAANPDINKAPESYRMKFEDYPFHHAMMKGYQERKSKYIYTLEGEEKKIYDQYLFTETEFRKVPAEAQAASKAMERYVVTFTFSNFGGLQTVSNTPLADASVDILSRFGKVFDLTYTRFNDLQKAEAQAREAQIEASLEKIRSRSLAMHSSGELKEVISVTFQKLNELNVLHGTVGIQLFDWNTMNSYLWVGNKIQEPQMINLPYDKEMLNEDGLVKDLWQAMKKGVDLINKVYSFEQKDRFFNYIFSHNDLEQIPETARKLLLQMENHVVCLFTEKKSALFVDSFQGELYTADEQNIIKRTAKVFEQAYIRFLDLQKAEAQARESQIQLALERVRARTMAMQKSEELPETSHVLFEQMKGLGEPVEQLTIGVVQEENRVIEISATLHGDILKKVYRHSIDEPFMMSKIYHAWKTHQKTLIVELKGDELNAYNKYRNELTKSEMFPTNLGDEHRRIVYAAFFSKGILALGANEPRPAESLHLLERFAGVFDQAYIRFIDLKNAEEQSRESQIQLALERVRARTAAMQKSDELSDVAELLFKQVNDLGVKTWTTGFNVWSDDNNFYTDYITNPNGGFLTPYTVDARSMPVGIELSKAKKRGDEVYVNYEEGEELANTYQKLIEFGESQFSSILKSGIDFPKQQYEYFIFGAKVSLMFITYDAVSPETFNVFKRFGKVFEQTYTRFLDLQKAEAQAKEAKIEAALERVRSRTMAMHKSSELLETAELLFDQLKQLGAELQGVAFAICDKDNVMVEKWTSIGVFSVPYNIEAGEERMYEAWKNQAGIYEEVYEGERIKKYYELFMEIPSFKMGIQKFIDAGHPLPTWQKNHAVTFKHGYLLLITTKPFIETQIFLRFGKVFEQTYTRFLDLQKAEAQAKESKIEAALERVRSRTLAMQKSDELAETAAVMFHQLINLGIEPNRLYIILLKEETGDMEAWVTDEDGSKVSRGFTGNFNRNETLYKMYAGWKEKNNTLQIDMQGEELQNYFHYLHDELKVPFKGGMEQKRRVQHIAYFSKGLIGIASPEPQPMETMQLLERFAAVFNLTYTRFNDLKIAEAHALQAEQDLIAIKEAKQKAEEALAELQSTQRQLIQTEKMASLGELTAGIAHEIQNPLNFVNNFSEVSHELIDEMKEELASGNIPSAIEIVDDVKENLEKILHHGKRADAIVKGMLQHSRSSSGTKEPTDINDLADEYLRLAFHGYRAKDKSFNAKFETHFDNSIEKINIIPQDFGRVLLNLINNAFYTVNEKRKQVQNGYEPTVVVSTKKENDKIIISVKDNGNGIPQKVLDKIFQPFFTTKPTGQGTGLGLSLSYDIITKGHGGEINVVTDEGKGAEFIISLPVNS